VRLSELMDSELLKLYAKFGQAKKGGRDLLQELAESIDGKVSYALERLQQLTPSDGAYSAAHGHEIWQLGFEISVWGLQIANSFSGSCDIKPRQSCDLKLLILRGVCDAQYWQPTRSVNCQNSASLDKTSRHWTKLHVTGTILITSDYYRLPSSGRQL
jgi:hypothetical protein